MQILWRHDPQRSGRVSVFQMQDALEKLNSALVTEKGSPLTKVQITELVTSLGGSEKGCHERNINYNEFLSSFEYVDTRQLANEIEILRLQSVSPSDKSRTSTSL